MGSLFGEMTNLIASLMIFVSTTVMPAAASAMPLLSPIPVIHQEMVLAEHQLDLTNRLPNPYGNQGFADNILLALHYLKGDVELPVDWEKIREPFEVSFTLQPGETFAFHGNVLPEFADPAVTMNSRFFIEEGYKSIAGLGGNGVCHLASLINWVASEVYPPAGGPGLEVVAKANHNFAPVPGVPREYGTSIRSQSPTQNLYIKNTFDYPVTFEFAIDAQTVVLKILRG